MVIPRFVQAALAGQPLEVHGDGNQTRCFCHVAGHRSGAEGADGRTGDVRARCSTSARKSGFAIRDLAERVRVKAGSSSEIVFVPYEEVFPRGAMEEMFHREPSIEKIGDAIG